MNWDTQDEPEWFADRLPRMCENACAYVFEYQRQHVDIDLIETIDRAAEDLLDSWERICLSSSQGLAAPSTEEPAVRRPLLFVCYGLGSIVVEKALLLAKKANGTLSMSRCTFGIVYLGAPHARDAQAWARSLKSKQITASMSVSKDVHFREPRGLAKIVADTFCSTDSNARTSRKRRYDNLPQYFSDIHNTFDSIACLYTSMHFCLDGDSSYCPGTSLHKDCLWSMSSQARISHYGEMHYIVPDALPRAVAKATLAFAIMSMGEAGARDLRERQTLLADQHMLKEMYSQQRLGRTGKWLLKSDRLQAWRNPTGSGLLWLYGAPGTGKSTICSTLIDKLQFNEEDCGNAFFCFFDESLGEVDPAQYVLRTFLYQFVGNSQLLIPDHLLRSVIRSLEKLKTPMTIIDFQEVLRKVLDKIPSQTDVLLVLDGLDGENWIKQVIVDEILGINCSMKRLKPFRCIISTRERCSVQLYLDKITRVNLNDEPGLHEDVRKFVSTWLTDVPQSALFGKLSSTSVAEQLCLQANGVFLWAALAIEEIFRMRSLENLVSKIKAMPMTVEGQYQKMLAAIPSSDVETAQTIFLWLIGARRLLHISDFREILEKKAVVCPSTFGTPSVPIKRTEHLSETDISRICGGLVVFAECGVARFRHETVREYLLCSSKFRVFKDGFIEAHELIAKTCIHYLSKATATENNLLASLSLPSSQRLQTEPLSSLADYALSNWSFHYRQAESHSQVLPGMLQRHLSNKLYKGCDTLVLRQSQRMIQISSAILRFSAFCGFSALAKMSLQMGSHPDGDACDRCETPLAIAAAKHPNNSQLLEVLLRKGGATSSSASESANLDATLLMASSLGLFDLVELKLARGADVQAVDRSGRTSLHIAADLGNCQMVELLMRFDADINATIPGTAATPLHLAAARGYLNIVKCLVDSRDASPIEISLFQEIVQEPSYKEWETSMTRGFVWEIDARDLAEKRLRRLLSCSDRYANIDTQTCEGSTPLHLAATNGKEETVQYLLSRGAADQTLTRARRTALQNAAENGHLGTMRLLMETRASLNCEPDSLRPIIQNADAKGLKSIASVLSFKSYCSEIIGKSCPWSTIAVATNYSPHDMSPQMTP